MSAPASDIREELLSKYPREFRHGYLSGFTGEPQHPCDAAGYMIGHHDWPAERKNPLPDSISGTPSGSSSMDEPVTPPHPMDVIRKEARAIAPKKKAKAGNGNEPGAAPDVPSPEFSEDQLALTFAARHGDGLRYVAAWGKWLAWIGTHWQHEDTLAVYDLARKICREAASQCNKASEAKVIAKAKTVAAIERLAKSDRAIAATIGQWDADKGLLNTPGEIINGKIGALMPHRREYYCTKITAVSPAAIAQCSSISCTLYLPETMNSSTIFK